jgi:hypothetical protein
MFAAQLATEGGGGIREEQNPEGEAGEASGEEFLARMLTHIETFKVYTAFQLLELLHQIQTMLQDKVLHNSTSPNLIRLIIIVMSHIPFYFIFIYFFHLPNSLLWYSYFPLFLQQTVFYRSLRLLVVDSLGAVISPCLGGKQSQGHALMMQIARQLKLLAHEFDIAVLVTIPSPVSLSNPSLIILTGSVFVSSCSIRTILCRVLLGQMNPTREVEGVEEKLEGKRSPRWERAGPTSPTADSS